MAAHTLGMERTPDHHHGSDAMSGTSGKQATDDPEVLEIGSAKERTEQAVQPHDPMSAVLNLPELLEPILSYLPTTDLTRALSVSKHWHGFILGSTILRRNLFLEPKLSKEYLGWARDGDEEFVRPVIQYEPNHNNKLIVSAHPAILSRSNPEDFDFCLDFELPRLSELQKIPAQTLVFQPPLTYFYLEDENGNWQNYISSPQGVTFGTVVTPIERSEQWLSNRAVPRRNRIINHAADEPKYIFWWSDAVLDNTEDVLDARKAPQVASTRD